MPVQIKHNNDGKFYHIAIDIAKEGAQLFDLTPYVKGRVGDNNFGLLVDWYRQGMLMNVNGAYKPIIDGLVGNFSFDKNGNLKMDDDASPVYSVGKPEDCGPAGQVTYYFPEQMFPKEGIFKGYLGLIDDKGNRYSGVDIWFSVLAGNARMGIACDFYISELEKAIKEAEEDLKAGQKEQQQILDEYSQKVTDLINQVNGQAADVQTTLANLRTTILALEAKAEKDNLFTQAEADAFKQAIADQLTNSVNQKVDAAIAEIKSYGLATTNIRKQISYNGYWSNLDLSHSGGVYTSSLDTIKNELDQMAPLVDGVTLLFHQYITGGKLVVLENLDTFKQAIDYAKSKGLIIAGYKFHCTTSIDDIKSYGVSEFFADYKANVDKVTSALPEAGVPLILFNERGDLYGATSPYSGNVRNVLQDLVSATFKVNISFQSLQDFISADPHVQELVDSILINSYARISDKKRETTLADVSSGIDANFYNSALYVHSLYPQKQMVMSEFGIKNNWAAFDEAWNWNFSSVYDDPTGKVSYLYLRGLMQSETIKLFDGVWLWFYADLLQSDAGKEYLRAYKKGVI